MNLTVGKAGPERKHTFLPLLVFLFVVSYGLLTMLVVLQDRTIDAQSDLIHLLFKESHRLKMIVAQNHPAVADKIYQKQADGTRVPSRQAPKVQVPSTQVPEKQNASPVPSSQEKASTKPGKNQHKAGKKFSTLPPAETTDPSDMRRTLFSI